MQDGCTLQIKVASCFIRFLIQILPPFLIILSYSIPTEIHRIYVQVHIYTQRFQISKNRSICSHLEWVPENFNTLYAIPSVLSCTIQVCHARRVSCPNSSLPSRRHHHHKYLPFRAIDEIPHCRIGCCRRLSPSLCASVCRRGGACVWSSGRTVRCPHLKVLPILPQWCRQRSMSLLTWSGTQGTRLRLKICAKVRSTY